LTHVPTTPEGASEVTSIGADLPAVDVPVESPAAPVPADGKAPGADVFAFASDFLRVTAMAAGKLGEAGMHWQVFDDAPLDDAAEPDLRDARLGREAARAVVAARAREGFKGLAGFSYLGGTSSAPALNLEAFDTRNGASVAFTWPMKRTFSGKYRPRAMGEFLGPAEPLQ
jgi:hypothetical protein